MKKGFIAAFLALIMVLALLPSAALAAAPTEVWVGSTNVTTGYESAKVLYGGTVQYKGGVLSLNRVTVGNTTNHNSAAIYANGDLTLKLVDASSVTGPETSGANYSYGVHVYGGSLTVSGAGSLNATGGSAFVRSTGVLVEFGYIEVSGGVLSGTGSSANNSVGVQCNRGITVRGGALSGTANNAPGNSLGVLASKKIEVSGGTLTAQSGNGSNVSCGVQSGEGISVRGGTLSAIAVGGVTSSYGMYAGFGSIVLTDGTTTAVGNKQAVNMLPVFVDATQTNENWYLWKELQATYEPAFYYISSDTHQFAEYTLAKYLKVAPAALPISMTPGATFPVGASGGDRRAVVGHGTSLAADEIGALTVGGNTLREGTDYTKSDSASVDITFKESWLNSLPVGTHRLNIEVTGGEYIGLTLHFDIIVTAPADVPKTGDFATPYLWAGLALLATMGLLASAALTRRKRCSN